jgi:hypothetical protein
MMTKRVVAKKSLQNVLRRHALPKARVPPVISRGWPDRSYWLFVHPVKFFSSNNSC